MSSRAPLMLKNLTQKKRLNTAFFSQKSAIGSDVSIKFHAYEPCRCNYECLTTANANLIIYVEPMVPKFTNSAASLLESINIHSYNI